MPVIPTTLWQAEGEELEVPAQHGQLSAPLRPCLKILKRAEDVALCQGPVFNLQY